MLIFRRFPRVWELVGAWEGKTSNPTGARTYARDTCACARGLTRIFLPCSQLTTILLILLLFSLPYLPPKRGRKGGCIVLPMSKRGWSKPCW